jgi:hypothetical protein
VKPLFVLRMFAELLGYDAAKFFTDHGWDELKNAIKVRDRITHPKSVEELHISDEDIKSLILEITLFYNYTFDPIRAKQEADEGRE